jgi:hypothetical protein
VATTTKVVEDTAALALAMVTSGTHVAKKKRLTYRTDGVQRDDVHPASLQLPQGMLVPAEAAVVCVAYAADVVRKYVQVTA